MLACCIVPAAAAFRIPLQNFQNRCTQLYYVPVLVVAVAVMPMGFSLSMLLFILVESIVRLRLLVD
jgi:hypothetical protein